MSVDMNLAAQHVEAYSAVYTAAENVDSWEGMGLPNGTQARLWQALDRIKDLGAPAADVRSAEEISIAMHRISLALRLPGPDAEAEVDQHKLELSSLSRQWLGQLPMDLSR